MKFLASSDPPGRKWRIGTLSALLGLTVGACTFDSGDRCDPHQKIYGDNLRCVCEEGTALTANGCVPCGAHEVPGTSGCVCESGYQRASAAVGCEPAPAALGADCSASKPCTDATYDHCEMSGDQPGYCTSTGCASSSECSGGYACVTSASPSLCKRPPVGQGKSCTAAADCEGSEATFCDTVQSHQCLVQGCSLTPNDCFEGWGCCDLSKFGLPQPLCLPQGACPQ